MNIKERRNYYLESLCGVAGEHNVARWKTPELASDQNLHIAKTSVISQHKTLINNARTYKDI